MISRAEELALRRQRLQQRSAELRVSLGVHGEGLAPLVRTAERVQAGIHWVRTHPEWVAGAAVALAVARPRRALRWARRGFLLWQTWRRVQGMAARLQRAGP